MNDRTCLLIVAHIHTPRLDSFDERVWERTLANHLDRLSSTSVQAIEVVSAETREQEILQRLEIGQSIGLVQSNFFDQVMVIDLDTGFEGE